MQITNWTLSDLVAKSDEPLSEGTHIMQIENATFDDTRRVYTLVLRCVETDQVSSIRFFLRKKDGTNNNHAIGTLNSLSTALFGDKGKGIPFMDDVLQGIVKADVVYSGEFPKADGSFGHYINIYKFLPVDRETYNMLAESGFALIEQYLEG